MEESKERTEHGAKPQLVESSNRGGYCNERCARVSRN